MWESLECVLCRVLAYRGRARGSCRNCLNDGIDVAGPRPLLVCQYIASDFLLFTLDEVDVGEHSLGLVALR